MSKKKSGRGSGKVSIEPALAIGNTSNQGKTGSPDKNSGKKSTPKKSQGKKE